MVAQFLLFISLLAIEQRSPLWEYRWEHRIVILNAQMPDSARLLEELLGKREELKARDILVFLKNGDNLVCKNAKISSVKDQSNRFSGVVLIGKDGGVKLQEDHWVEVEAIFDLIDSMPMRQSEMRRKNH